MKKLLKAKRRGKEQKWQHGEGTEKTDQIRGNLCGFVTPVQMTDESKRVFYTSQSSLVWCFECLAQGVA